jgi:surface carbohydrate biosynthesis protein
MFFKILSIFSKCKFDFKELKAFDLVVLDDTSIEYLENIINHRRYFTFVTRSENLKKIYLTPKIIFYIFFYFRGNLFTAYLCSLLKVINPNVVITYIDNSPRFHILAKLFKDNMKFIAIQNAARYDLDISEYLIKKKINVYDCKNYFVPNFLCFGQYEIDQYKKKKIKAYNFKKIGSIKVSNFRRKEKKKLFKKKKYDICLISDAAFNFDNFFQLKGFEEGFAKIVKYTIKFCKKNNRKLIFPTKRFLKNDKLNEIYFFKKNLTNLEFNYLLKNSFKRNIKNRYTSYEKICESNVTLGCATSMLREALSLGRKIMVCNFTPTKIYDFPLKEFFFLKNPSYQDFEKKLKMILSFSEKKYFDALKENRNYMIQDSNKIDANDEVNAFIDNILKKNFKSLELKKK